MNIKKALRFFTLSIFIIIATILPFPIPSYKRDKVPTHKIELIDEKEEDENEENDYEAFS